MDSTVNGCLIIVSGLSAVVLTLSNPSRGTKWKYGVSKGDPLRDAPNQRTTVQRSVSLHCNIADLYDVPCEWNIKCSLNEAVVAHLLSYKPSRPGVLKGCASAH